MRTLPDATPAKPRILVVEDESLVALDLEMRLQRLGYEVCSRVDNADDAVSEALALRPDLVLMDIHLLGAADGIDAAALIRAASDLPVVFLTAHSDDSTLTRAGVTEPFGYVLKPFQERELRATIEMAFYRKKAEDRQRQMERWLATTLGSIGDGVIATDLEGRINYLNPIAEFLTGCPRALAIGIPLGEVFNICKDHEPARIDEIARQAMTSGAVIHLAEGHSLQRRDGKQIPIDDSIAPIRDQNNNLSGCVVIFRDASERKHAEDQRRQLEEKMYEAQRLESLGVLAGGVAHDFNNLLHVIACSAELAAKQSPGDGGIASYLNMIEDASRRAALLCSQMLAYAGKGRIVLREKDLSAFVREAEPLLSVAVGKDTRLELDLAPELPPVCADESQLQQVVMNLVINAAEAMQGKPGTVALRTARYSATRDSLAECCVGDDLPPGEYIALEVRDRGQGISPTMLNRIFDPFYTTKFSGRGLGLAAVAGIVRSHGGAISVESALGVGTVFRILLRPVVGAIAPTQSAEPSEPWPKYSGRVLLVDDEEAVRSVVADVLRHLGFTVDTAQDGAEGVEKVLANQGKFRVVFLDLTMPKLNGARAFRKIRETYPHLPVVMMSGYSNEFEAIEEDPCAIFFPKPFRLGELAGKLGQLFRDADAQLLLRAESLMSS